MKKSSSYYRYEARRALGGSIFHKNWLMALVLCLIFSLLGGSSSGTSFSFNMDFSSDTTEDININPNFESVFFLLTIISFVLIFVVILSAVSILYIGHLKVGLCRSFLHITREGEVKLGKLFTPYAENYWSTVKLYFMHGLYIFLWSLLFIIPGIVKSYSYSMAFYIKSDNPDMEWSECLNKSEELMNGNKWRLFALHFSFIGWGIVASLTCGIGVLWLTPYMCAAEAAFYQDLLPLTVQENTNAEFEQTI